MSKSYLDVYECYCRRPTKFMYKIESSPQNIAAFIASAPYDQDYALIDLNDECVLTTMGKYADLIPDEGFRKDILKYLIPMQMGEAEIPKVKYKDVKKERSSDDWYRY
ncbi:hypothetical protein MKA46_06190 [[Clostridium] innocuum]|nr:hypothetical protein [[Clostridium] innocuum]